uniref:Uncharacterized protein n=1 Tax=Glossina pallidipes TaxID=7398 RepID=A0A1A9ZYF6_GLOPL
MVLRPFGIIVKDSTSFAKAGRSHCNSIVFRRAHISRGATSTFCVTQLHSYLDAVCTHRIGDVKK